MDFTMEALQREQNSVTVGGGEQRLQLHYLNEKVVQKLMEERAKVDPETSELLEHLKTHDVKEGIYEGGFKVWEGTLDLANFLLSKECNFDLKGKEVFEVGCGAGLLGIVALKKGCKRVVMQDYNDMVLQCFTRNNFVINNLDVDDAVEFVHGDWLDLATTLHPKQFDLIVTAETIYNEESYVKLHDLMFATLKDDGCIFLAAKVEYFGVGGSIGAFLHYVRQQGKFSASVVWTSSSAVPRKIVKLQKC